jgi:hypothetical protein
MKRAPEERDPGKKGLLQMKGPSRSLFVDPREEAGDFNRREACPERQQPLARTRPVVQ